MKLLHCVALIVVLLVLPGPDCRASAEADSEGPPPLDCRSGPLKKTYGNEAWLVYGCNDHRSAVVVSDKGNPAVPFYFILYVKPDDSVRLYGEGTGNKSDSGGINTRDEEERRPRRYRDAARKYFER